jgi:hypothetical protein
MMAKIVCSAKLLAAFAKVDAGETVNNIFAQAKVWVPCAKPAVKRYV